MKTVEDRVYVDGKLVSARRSNVGLETDLLLPGPGAGVPRANRLGFTATVISEWPFGDDGKPLQPDKD